MGDSFTHLHVHTEYSMLDGASRLSELVAAAAADGQPALGITDHGNMYGILEFYKECRAPGHQADPRHRGLLAHEHRSERPARRGRIDDTGGDAEGGKKLYYHLTLLAETDAGYRNLIKLSSLAFLEGYYYKPRMDWELLERHHEGLIATTGCLGGHVLQALLHGDERARARAGGPAPGHLRARQPVRRAAGPRPRRPSARPTRSCSRSPSASRRRSSPPTTATTPTSTTTWPTTPCCACRPARS